MSGSTMPDLTAYRLHRTERRATFEGVAVPGLSAEFYRRPVDGRVASVGRYTMAGREVLMAWGYVDEEHCRHSAVRDPEGGWHEPAPGCPAVRVEPDGLAVRTPQGEWLRYPDRVASG